MLMTTARKVVDEHAGARSSEESVQFATAGVRLAGGTVTEENEAATRRVLTGEKTAEQELSALRRTLGY